jgi:hypothetical protein
MAKTESGQNSGHLSLTLESRSKGLGKMTIPSNLGGGRGNSICLSDSEEDMTGYTSPPPQQKKKLSIRENFEENPKIEHQVTHEFMSHKKFEKQNCDFSAK